MLLTLFCRPILTICSTLMLLLLVGCGSSDMTGKVTVDGVEVGVGTLYFNPDLDAGNDGPSIFADVKDGTFTTHAGSKVTPGKNNVTLTIAKAWLDSKGQDESIVVNEGEDVATASINQSFTFPDESTYDLKFVTSDGEQ